MVLIACLIFLIALTSCSSFGFGTVVPGMNTARAFENDTWLLIDNMLANKAGGGVYRLEPHSDATIPGVYSIYYHGPYTYKVEFEESAFKQYTFLKTSHYSEKSDEITYKFYDCVFTYDYKGQEIDRTYLGDIKTKEEVEALYQTEDFSYEIDLLWKNDGENSGPTKQRILEYAENIYRSLKSSINAVAGTAKPMGEEVWFSVGIFKDGDFNSGSSLLEGIQNSEIKSYHPKSDEIKSVFVYDKKEEAIVDFDENGLYTYDSNGKLKYFDIESKKSTVIHKFRDRVYSFQITDNYIGVIYEDGQRDHYLVYEKGGSIVANGAYK